MPVEEMTIDQLFAEIARRVPDGAALLLVVPRFKADDEKMKPLTHGSIVGCTGMCVAYLSDVHRGAYELEDPDDWQK